jgi:hypothetical protein
MAKVFLACPLYDGRLHVGAAKALYARASRGHTVSVAADTCSLLTANCNRHWSAALNRGQQQGYEWFAMLHSDVEPEEWWLDKSIDLAERHDADALSAVAPLKDSSGMTSTAIAHPSDRFRLFTQLTQAQVNHPSFPAVFDIEQAVAALAALPEPLTVPDVPISRLLVNTGCFVCRLDRPWCQRVHFANEDQLARDGGLFTAQFYGEDWLFSRRIAEEGGRVMATKSIRLKHWGSMAFESSEYWGAPRDPHTEGLPPT